MAPLSLHGSPRVRPAQEAQIHARKKGRSAGPARAASERANGTSRLVAYFSMEVGLESDMPTYAGGLGVLAGDTLKAAADLGVPLVGVTLVHRGGYFRQALDASGSQTEEPAEWSPEHRLEPVPVRVEIELERRRVAIRAWCFRVIGRSGFEIPVYLLDTDLPENAAADRDITDRLYMGDDACRLKQEAVLGLGGVALLRALGLRSIRTYHMNEGHSALLGLALLEDEAAAVRDGGWAGEPELEAVRGRCVFTTHTPVPAGHDRFPLELVRHILGERRAAALDRSGTCVDGELNMTHLALHLSGWLNGVAMRHREVSRGMFPGYPINAITNGVHVRTWVAPAFQELFDAHIPEWRQESMNLRYAIGIPVAEIRQAHGRAKEALLAEVERRTGRALDPAVLTIGFARRATPYKRANLALRDPDRLRRIASEVGPLQFVFAGKAHPHDEAGKEMIRRVHEAADRLGGDVPVVYLPGYDMRLGGLMTAGVDVWLNTPRKPQEASGTSGMKAALNGVPSFSVLDGWWIEGCVHGVTGWSIGTSWEVEGDEAKEISAYHGVLARELLPLYYGSPERFGEVMRYAIALNGSFFNAERMIFQYAVNAYGLPIHARDRAESARERAALMDRSA
ncbi:MAG: alpha-glucan family phosphorylase [Longimicrobiales bacterium]